jgi:hypothetical protein
LNGVTKAVKDPRKFVLAAMAFLQTRGNLPPAQLPEPSSIHIGSDAAAKGPLILHWPRFRRGAGADIGTCPQI